MISVYQAKDHRWRDSYNPLRGLTMCRLVGMLEAGERGQFADLQWLYYFMERSDAVIASVVQRRRAALLSVDWDIRVVASNDQKAEIGKAESRNEAAGKAEDFHREDAKNAKVSNAGLWAKIRWSDAGEACVRGGRYRFISPVWARADCEDLGDGRVRPVRLLNAAVTNDPNMKGMVPLSNRRSDDLDELTAKSAENAKNEIANAAPGQRLKWVLGDGGSHYPCVCCVCDVCVIGH